MKLIFKGYFYHFYPVPKWLAVCPRGSVYWYGSNYGAARRRAVRQMRSRP